MRKEFGFYSSFVFSAMATLWATTAAAQTSTEDGPSPTISGQPSAYADDDDDFDGDHITMGIGGMYQPAYAGARKYEFQPIVALDIKRGNFFVNFEDGIGFAAIDNETFTAGAGIVLVFDSYERGDVPNRFNNINMGAGARGFVSMRQFGFEATASVTQIFAGSTRGVIAELSLSRDIEVTDRLFLTPSIGAQWANAKHNNRFYGVDARQSLESGLPQFRPGAGFQEAEAELMLEYRVTDHIGFGLAGGVTTLLGNAKNSPIIRRKTAPSGMAFLTYTF